MTTHRRKRRFGALLITPLVALTLAACSKDSTKDTGAGDTAAATEAAATEASTDTAAATDAAGTEAAAATDAPAADTGSAAGSESAMGPECAPDKLALKNAGKLTIGTDSPAYPPWFSDDTPANGKGFESAVAFAVAETLGITKENVQWIKVPFNSSYAPGKKDFDFDINQISITEERKQAVDFSDGYFDVNQAVVALKTSKAASAKSLAELAGLKFGVQQGTTSLQFVTDVVKPSAEPFVYSTNNDAKAALAANQIDAVVVDLPTAFYISAAEIENSLVVGQFASNGTGEQFGMLFEKGSALTSCVNQALSVLKGSGKLAEIQTAELATATNAPVFS